MSNRTRSNFRVPVTRQQTKQRALQQKGGSKKLISSPRYSIAKKKGQLGLQKKTTCSKPSLARSKKTIVSSSAQPTTIRSKLVSKNQTSKSIVTQSAKGKRKSNFRTSGDLSGPSKKKTKTTRGRTLIPAPTISIEVGDDLARGIDRIQTRTSTFTFPLNRPQPKASKVNHKPIARREKPKSVSETKKETSAFGTYFKSNQPLRNPFNTSPISQEPRYSNREDLLDPLSQLFKPKQDGERLITSLRSSNVENGLLIPMARTISQAVFSATVPPSSFNSESSVNYELQESTVGQPSSSQDQDNNIVGKLAKKFSSFFMGWI